MSILLFQSLILTSLNDVINFPQQLDSPHQESAKANSKENIQQSSNEVDGAQARAPGDGDVMDSLKLKEALARERELQQQLEEANHRAEKEKEEAEKRIKAAEEKNGDVPQGKAKLYKFLVSCLSKMVGSCYVIKLG